MATRTERRAGRHVDVEQAMAMIVKSHELGGNRLSADAVDRARRILEGRITGEQARAELDAKYRNETAAIADAISAVSPTPAVGATQVERRMQFADAALALAGHEVTDKSLTMLSRRVAAGTMSADDAIAAGVAHLDAQ
jgi:anti-sigma-K factor RskA